MSFEGEFRSMRKPAITAASGSTGRIAPGPSAARSQEGTRCQAREPLIAPDLPPPGERRDLGAAGLQLMLDSDAGAPGRARAAIRDWSEHMLMETFRRDALELLVSEVVTNAVRHAEARAEEPINLAASIDECEILVRVTDGGGGSLPRMGPPRGQAGGYGLRIVDRESRRWGVERQAGTSVWFAI